MTDENDKEALAKTELDETLRPPSILTVLFAIIGSLLVKSDTASSIFGIGILLLICIWMNFIYHNSHLRKKFFQIISESFWFSVNSIFDIEHKLVPFFTLVFLYYSYKLNVNTLEGLIVATFVSIIIYFLVIYTLGLSATILGNFFANIFYEKSYYTDKAKNEEKELQILFSFALLIIPFIMLYIILFASSLKWSNVKYELVFLGIFYTSTLTITFIKLCTDRKNRNNLRKYQ